MKLLTCNSCQRNLPEDKFSRKSASRTGRQSKCKDCHNAYVKDVWYVKNKQKQIDSSARWKINNKAKYLATKYGVSEGRIQELIDKGSCDICGSKSEPLHIDHCHDTGIVRGILCRSCNWGLGHMKDSVDTLSKAVLYLTKHS